MQTQDREKNNQKQNNREQKDYFNWKVLTLLVMATTIGGLYRNGIMTLFPFIQAEYGLSKTQVGLYSTFMYISSVSMAVFSGWIADSWGTKKAMFAGLSSIGVFIFLHSLSTSFTMMLILASGAGLGLSILQPTGSKGASEWFSKENRATAVGMITLGLSLGGVISASTLPWLASVTGWKNTVIILAAIYIIFAFIFLTAYKDKKKDSNVKSKENKSLIKSISILIKNKKLLALCFLGVGFGVSSGVLVSHFTLYLFSDFGFSEVNAGLGFMILQIGSVVGRPGWGIINDRLLNSNDRNGFIIIGVLISVISLIFSFLSNFNPPIFIILILAFLFGLVGRGWNGLYFSAVSKHVKEKNTGISVGFSLFFVRFGIVIGPPIFGLIADKTGSYNYSWLVLSIYTLLALIVSIIILSKLNKSYTKQP